MGFTIEEGIDDLTYAIQGWLSTHATADEWIEHIWSNAGSLAYVYEEDCTGYNLEGRSVQDVVHKHWAKLMTDQYDLYYCDECGEQYEQRCPDCNLFIRKMDHDYWLMLAEDCGLEGYDNLEEAVESALHELFDYFVKIHGLEPIIEDMGEALNGLEHATDGPDKLAAFLFAMHINHAGGSIADYCGVVTWDDINDISQNGPDAFFGAEELNEFMEYWA